MLLAENILQRGLIFFGEREVLPWRSPLSPCFLHASLTPGNLLVIAFVSYFGAKLHRPKIIAVGCVLMSIGTFIIALPHFIIGRWVKKQMGLLNLSLWFITSPRHCLCAAMSLRPRCVGWSTPQSTLRLAHQQTRPAPVRWLKCLTKVRNCMGRKCTCNEKGAISVARLWPFASCRVWGRVQLVHVDLRAAGKRPAWDWGDPSPTPWHLLHWWFRHGGKCGAVCR